MQSSLLAYPFRVFFLLTAAFGALVVLAWLALLSGWAGLPLALPATWWHGHEMLYGLVPAAMAGFLLTAMANWTGVAPPKGTALLALATLWLAGRLAMALGGWLPTPLVAVVDLAFLPALAAVAARMLWRGGNRRNAPIVVVLLALTAGNALMHAAFMGWGYTLARAGELLALDLIALLMALIGGRITPAFTRNWLKGRGADPAAVRTRPWLDRAALAAIVVLAVLDIAAPYAPAIAVAAILAAVLHAIRLAGWSGWRTTADPLVWILHLGYAWLPVAFALRAAATLELGVTSTAWMHALGAGAMATLILGVMARVAVGHTGRGLVLRPGARWVFGLITLAAALRVAAGLGLEHGALHGAGWAWIAAFVIFLIGYGPVFNRPRADGQPG